MRVGDHAETEVGGHTLGDVLPGVAIVVTAIQPPMVLEIQTIWVRRIAYHLVHALAEFGMFFGKKLCANSLIARLPRFPAIVGAIHAAGRHGDDHALAIRGMGRDGMKALAASAGRPLGAVGMLE